MTDSPETPVPPQAPQASVAVTPSPSRGLAITALVLGIVALLGFAIPVLNVFSALIALVGLVLGIVALVRAQSRGLSIAGVVTSALALLLSLIFIVIYLVGFGAAVESVRSDTTFIENESPAAEEEETTSEETSTLGTRENPAPLGTTIEIVELGETTYEVTLGPATLEANDVVLEANMFNDPPADGFQYALLPVQLTYVGSETGTPWIDLSIKFVSAAGTTHTEGDSLVVAPEPTLMDINELYPGASAEGNVVIAIPTDGAANGTWTVSALFGEPFFFTAE